MVLQCQGQPQGSHEVHGKGLVVKVVDVASDAIVCQGLAVQLVRPGLCLAAVAAKLPPAGVAEVGAVDEVEARQANWKPLAPWCAE